MGKDKAQRANKGAGRDPGGFIALPWSVVDCPAYRLLSHPARTLLIEFARQYVKNNNGRLLATNKYLFPRGWKSSDVIQRAKNELIKYGFIYETVKGCRPNKASWYAITWQNLDKHNNYDAGVFEGWREARSSYTKLSHLKIKELIPSKGTNSTVIEPSDGVMKSFPTLPNGAISDTFNQSLTPSDGDHLEIPSKHYLIERSM